MTVSSDTSASDSDSDSGSTSSESTSRSRDHTPPKRSRVQEKFVSDRKSAKKSSYKFVDRSERSTIFFFHFS